METESSKTTSPSPAPQNVPTVDARQGVISGRVITVLVASTFLAIVAMFAAWLLFR